MSDISLRKDMLKCASQSILDLKEFFGDKLERIFLYGSLSKGKVHENSDIDVLCIGTLEKDISLLNRISEFIYNKNYKYEINVKYYNLNKFRELYNNNNLFLHSIKYDLLRLEDINELL